ncbi:MAG: LysM peptidoglycan-binding domain-containing protein [Candidatus Acidiferrum sp.]
MTTDQLGQLKLKYQSVLNFMQAQNVQLSNINLQDNKLFIRATAPSQSVKDEVWNQIKLVDANYSSDLIADIQAPAAAAAAAGATPVDATRKYTVQAGDSLSKISQHFYGNASQYMKIFEANKDQLSDPDKIKPGMNLIIP